MYLDSRNRQTKLKVYKTIIRPIAAYASEAWVQTKILSSKVDIFERRGYWAKYMNMADGK